MNNQYLFRKPNTLQYTVVLFALTVSVLAGFLSNSIMLFFLAEIIVLALVIFRKIFDLSLKTAMLSLVFLSNTFLASIDFGSFSLRVYILILSILLCLIDKDSMVKFDHLRKVNIIVLFYSLFITWSVIASIANGMSVYDAFEYAIGRHFFAISVLYLTIFSFKKLIDVKFFAYLMIFSLVVSCIFAVFQWLGYSQAWYVWAKLYPNSQTGDLYADDSFGNSLISGLFGSSVILGYYISTLSPMMLFILQKKKIIGAVGAFVLSIGVLVVQQRATLIAWLVITLAYLFFYAAKNAKRFVIALLTVMILTVAVAFSSTAGLQDMIGGGRNLSRYSNFEDNTRKVLFQAAVDYSKENLVFGGLDGYIKFSQRYPEIGYGGFANPPHNIFMNALVFYGLPSLFLVICILFLITKNIIPKIKIALYRNDILMLAIILGLLGYFLSSLFHNSSIVTGDILPWWMIGFLEVVFCNSRLRMTRRADVFMDVSNFYM